MRDFYGRLRSAQNGNTMDAPMVYQIEAVVDGDVITRYIRFDADDDKPIAVWRETEEKDGDGNIISFTREFGITKWSERTSDPNNDKYVPINKCWEV